VEIADLYIEKYSRIINSNDLIKLHGRITDVVGFVVQSIGPNVKLGEICSIIDREVNEVGKSEVVRFKDGKVVSIALGEMKNVSPHCEILATGESFKVAISDNLLGRVIDGLGNPIDDLADLEIDRFTDIYSEPPNPLQRSRISEPLQTGIRAIDGLLTCGKGQRVGIFAGSGVGKSTLLGMFAKKSSAEVNVIALIGERGREVR
jgi:flagellum-specific ATP synthase